MEEVRSGADSPDLDPLIPMIDADFLHGSSKSVEVGPKLPLGFPDVLRYSSEVPEWQIDVFVLNTFKYNG